MRGSFFSKEEMGKGEGLGTLPCTLFGSNREPGSGWSLGEWYRPVKRPPHTRF